jgi:hypothetical protein
MSVYEIEYADEHGNHAEAVEGWDREDAIHAWRAQHSGERVRLLDAIRIGEVKDLEVVA